MIRPALRPDNALASQTGDSSLARKLSLFAPLSDADRDRFLELLENPPAPNAALKRAAQSHAERRG